MKLTRRQEQFLQNLLDLYYEVQEPLHYTVLAERLGVSRFTAYDMLRLLEDKGLAASSYQLAEGKEGPGRSEVVYAPTAQARRMIAELTDEVGGTDWADTKRRILARFPAKEHERPATYALAVEMLERVPPDEPGVVRYCVEVMTVIALRLRRRSGRSILLAYLPQLLAEAQGSCRANLSLLGGFALGILADEAEEDQQWAQELLAHVRQYHELVLAMQPELCRLLARRLDEIFAPLQLGEKADDS